MIGSMGVATMVQSYTTIQNLEQKMNADAAKKVGTDRTAIALVWSDGPGQGRLELTDGTIGRIRIVAGQGEIRDAEFSISGRLPRLEVDLSGVKLGLGACPTLATVRTERNAFTFLPRDVRRANPIFLPQYGVAITTADDPRGYDQIADEIRSSGRVSDSMRFNAEPEETFEAACGRNRKQVAPTWLGLSRDMRTFEVGHCEEYGFWGMIQPRYHGSQVTWPELNNGVVILKFVVGPGVNCRTRLTRRLDDGCLPVLRSQQVEDDVTYDLTAFATLEREPLTVQNVRGTQWQAAYAQTGGNMLSQDDYRALAETTEAETRRREQETICCVRVKACNTGDVPRYAWFRTVRPVAGHQLFLPVPLERDEFDSRAGCSLIDDDRIYAVTLFNNRPMPQSEMAVLLGPGEIATWDMLIPHCPITRRRAEKLAAFDYDRHLASCRAYWRDKLDRGGCIRVPEKGIDERIRAGLVHCEVNTLGMEAEGPLLPTIGVYAPIGSESSPIIQFFDSMGWHALAERCLDFFLQRQRDDGFIQNFGGYQLETGPVLWTMGEHYRYTRDKEWVRRVRPNILKACDYLLTWRDRNKRQELRGKGYGLQDGKVADPEDFFHSFMLNALSYLGIRRAAQMLDEVSPADAKRLEREADEYRADIRTAVIESIERSPVIPTGDGTWVRSCPPWAEYRGPVALFAEGGEWYTSHGAFGCRDSLIGALYLVIGEVFDADETTTEDILRSHQELFTVENAGFSQPYYCRHDYVHLKRGEVKEFLKTYYNQLTALQDRETYTFWEHYHRVSPNKTHEEAWFLMQTRWMLWLEEGQMLSLLRCVPRRWLEHGQRIRLENVASYFGPLSLEVVSRTDEGFIKATIECDTDRKPKDVSIRLPHPMSLKARGTDGGVYVPESETVLIREFTGKAEVMLRF